jgi:protein phosphatase
MEGLSFELAGFSEKGPREENQDVLTLSDFPRTGIVAVADGMGGERAGRIAAETALAEILDSGPIRNLFEARAAVRRADAAIAGRASTDAERYGGMGCALAFLSFSSRRGDGPLWICCHVGDVRVVSRAPDGTVRLETKDHSEAFARWEAGEIALDDVPRSEGHNRLKRSVGRGGEPDVTFLPVRAGWRYAIMSDGVSRAVGLPVLGQILARRSAVAAGDAIRECVQTSGADDNFSALVIRIGGAPNASWKVNKPRSGQTTTTRSALASLFSGTVLASAFGVGTAHHDSPNGREDNGTSA